ncbi:MAG: hypothetical protein ACLTZY_12940 [Alistipes indistinctus]
MVLYSPSRGYFRIDLRDSNRQYIDVRRNTRIRVNIKNIFGYGYLSAEESLLLPGSNIQFSIKIDGDEDVIINNGQYVLLLSHDRKVVPDAPGTYVVATGRYSPSPELPPTPPDGLTNTITLSDIKPANAAPKLTLETHSLSDVAQPIKIARRCSCQNRMERQRKRPCRQHGPDDLCGQPGPAGFPFELWRRNPAAADHCRIEMRRS